MIDFTGRDKIVYEWSLDTVNGHMTIIFRDSTDTTELGSIKIEKTRLASFLDSMRQSGVVFMPKTDDLVDREFYGAKFTNQENKTTLEFR